MKRGTLHRAASLVALVITAACQDPASPAASSSPAPDGPLYARGGSPRVVPNGKGIGTRSYSPGPRTKYRVEYHNGPLMLMSHRVYFIFYGNWPYPSPAEQILTNFVLDLSGSSYFGINSLYTDGSGGTPGHLLWGRNLHDSYSRGATLSDADVEAVVANTITTGLLPLDPGGVYVMVASPDVGVSSGLGVTYCAFHQKTTVVGTRVAYAFIGSPARNPSQCAPQLSSPNGDWAADAMTSLLAAELSNAITDPAFDAWYDRLGLEPADKCAWNFGPTYQAPNGALANIRLGGRDYLLQRLWVPAPGNGGYCAMAAPSP